MFCGFFSTMAVSYGRLELYDESLFSEVIPQNNTSSQIRPISEDEYIVPGTHLIARGVAPNLPDIVVSHNPPPSPRRTATPVTIFFPQKPPTRTVGTQVVLQTPSARKHRALPAIKSTSTTNDLPSSTEISPPLSPLYSSELTGKSKSFGFVPEFETLLAKPEKEENDKKPKIDDSIDANFDEIRPTEIPEDSGEESDTENVVENSNESTHENRQERQPQQSSDRPNFRRSIRARSASRMSSRDLDEINNHRNNNNNNMRQIDLRNPGGSSIGGVNLRQSLHHILQVQDRLLTDENDDGSSSSSDESSPSESFSRRRARMHLSRNLRMSWENPSSSVPPPSPLHVSSPAESSSSSDDEDPHRCLGRVRNQVLTEVGRELRELADDFETTNQRRRNDGFVVAAMFLPIPSYFLLKCMSISATALVCWKVYNIFK